MKTSPEIIYLVAKALEELNEQSVFVGGATLPFYLRKEQKSDARATEDVDVVLNIVPKVPFYKRE